MSVDRNQKVILVADTDPEDLWAMKSDPRAKTSPMVAAANEREATLWLCKEGQKFSAIFLNPDIQPPYAMKLVQLAAKCHPGVPVFYLTNKGSLALTAADLENLGIRKVLRKPLIYADLVKFGRLHAEGFDSEAAIELALSTCALPLGAEIESDEDVFVPIRAAQFMSGSLSFFDVHLKTAERRFVKVVKAGQRPDAATLAEHLKNGVVHYYLRATAHESYVRYCDHLGSMLTKKTGVPLLLKAGFLFNHGEEVLHFIRRSGPSEDALDYARRFLASMRGFAATLPMSSRQDLLQFIIDMSDFSHEVTSTFIAKLMCHALAIESERLVENVGLAALLQDIGLDLPGGELDPKNLEGEELERYLRHPLESARIVKRAEGIDPVVVQAIEQHHERKGQTGFPYGLGVNSINQFAEIVGLADELSNLAKKTAPAAALDAMKEWELGLSCVFSTRTAEAFRSLFADSGRSKQIFQKTIQGGSDVA